MEQSPAAIPPPPPDFRLLFESAPGLYLVLAPDLTIVAVSDAYLHATMTTRDQLLGRNIFAIFPDNPADPAATGVENLRASLARVIRDRAPDTMAVQKYDIRRPADEGDGFEDRYWSPVNVPVLGPTGGLAYIIHRVKDVTTIVHTRQAPDCPDRVAADDVLLRAQEIQDVNRRLREVNDELGRTRAELEQRVVERTARLSEVNTVLRAEILERRRAEETLRDSESRLRGFFEATTAGMVEVSRHIHIIRANDAFCRMLGYSTAEIAG